MSTLCNDHPTSTLDSSRLKALLLRIANAWTAWQQARADRHLDRWHHHTRNEHERFLSSARDHYELERREQAWERRHSDLWRVY